MEAPPNSSPTSAAHPADQVRTAAYFKPVATCSLVETCGFPETGWRSEKQAHGRLRPLAHPSSPTRVQGGVPGGGAGEELLPSSMALAHSSGKGEAEVRLGVASCKEIMGVSKQGSGKKKGGRGGILRMKGVGNEVVMRKGRMETRKRGRQEEREQEREEGW